MRRYHTLDGLRGVAAIAVLMGHSAGLVAPLPLPRAWLAVDLFFVLSGFVIANVYEPRFRSGTTTVQFMIQRYIRLWPMFAVGLLVGLLSEASGMFLGHADLSWTGLFLATLTGLAILPSPTFRESDAVFPLNKPGWSLAFELFINLVYVAFWRLLRTPVIVAIMAFCAAALLWLYAQGSGFQGTSYTYFWGGFPRVGFSFFAGVLIARHEGRRAPRETWATWLMMAVLLVALFAFPSSNTSLIASRIDLFWSLVGFPALVLMASRVEPVRPAAFMWLGALSYPLYAIHAPIIYLGWRAISASHIPLDRIAPWIGLSFGAGVIAVSLLLERYYDGPLRAWLSARLLRRKPGDRTKARVGALVPSTPEP